MDYIPKNPNRQVTIVESNGHHNNNTHQAHSIIKATLKNHETYVIDITGAKFGHYDPVTPWDIYTESRVESIKIIHPLNNINNSQNPVPKARNTCGSTLNRKDEFAEVFLSAAESWQIENGLLDAMLKLREDAFERTQTSLSDFFDRRVRERKAGSEEEKDVSKKQ